MAAAADLDDGHERPEPLGGERGEEVVLDLIGRSSMGPQAGTRSQYGRQNETGVSERTDSVSLALIERCPWAVALFKPSRAVVGGGW